MSEPVVADDARPLVVLGSVQPKDALVQEPADAYVVSAATV